MLQCRSFISKLSVLLPAQWITSSSRPSVSCTEAFYTQLQEEQLSRSDPAISFSVASGALTLETGEGSLKSPGQESNLNSCFPGGTLLRFGFFCSSWGNSCLRWSELSIHLCMDSLSSPSELLPILFNVLFKVWALEQGRLFQLLSHQGCLQKQEQFPLPAWTPSLWYGNQNAEEGRTDCHEVDNILIINAHG